MPQVVLHSPGAIASVGVLHPTAFHVQTKGTPSTAGAAAAPPAAEAAAELASAAPGTAPGNVDGVTWAPSDWRPSNSSTAAADSESSSASDDVDVAVTVTSSAQHVHMICRPTVSLL